jgi:hypothetical protein
VQLSKGLVAMTEPETTAAPLTGARAKAATTYVALSGLFVLGVFVAFLLAGHGVFGLNHHDLSASHHHLPDQKVLDAHRAVGTILGLLALLSVIAIGIARPGRKLVIGQVVLLLLASPGQEAFAGGGESHSWLGGLHVLNAGVILALSIWLHLNARKVPRA